MMDGRVGAIKQALSSNGLGNKVQNINIVNKTLLTTLMFLEAARVCISTFSVFIVSIYVLAARCQC